VIDLSPHRLSSKAASAAEATVYQLPVRAKFLAAPSKPLLQSERSAPEDALPVESRGGAGLSNRLALWSASLSAIRARPIFGTGPGTDALAIAPYLTGRYTIYRGLTSHNTWLRTAVELGLPGLVLIIVVILSIGWKTFQGVRLDRTLLDDATTVALGASVLGLLADQFFETYLLGGATFSNFYWALSMALLVTAFSTRRQSGSS
jgi:O-antigen ligase